MSSILVSLYKATLGFLVNKARDKTADKLKDGDVLDHKFRDMIVREIDDIKTKLDGLARKDLLASIEFFKQGVVNLNKVFEKSMMETNSEEPEATAAVKSSHEVGDLDAIDTSTRVASLVTKRIENLRVTDLNESAKQSLADAKERFKAAHFQATNAFSNEALKTSDRILAVKIQLMATILERLDRPTDVLDECRIYLQNLNDMPEVRENFKVHLTAGLKSLLNKKDREAIIAAVCQVNHVVFRVMQVINGGKDDSIRLPCVEIGRESVDVLCDKRITETLVKLGMAEFCRGFWSFGQKGSSEQRVNWPMNVTTSSGGQFIVAEQYDCKVKVYDCSGIFQYSICPSVDGSVRYIMGLATDPDDNVYTLVDSSSGRWVVVSDQQGKQLHRFHTSKRGLNGYSMTVNDKNQVFVMGSQFFERYGVELFETDGEFVRSFGQEILKHPRDIASANDGRVLVLDTGARCVYTFSARGDIQQQFWVQDCNYAREGSIAYDLRNQTVVVCLWDTNEKLLIYTKDGILLHDVQKLSNETTLDGIRGVAVTVDGRIAVIKEIGHRRSEICVFAKERLCHVSTRSLNESNID